MALYLSEHSQEQVLGFGDLILRSARQELSSLVSICLISEKNRAVGFLHWSVIIFPKLPLSLSRIFRANTTSNRTLIYFPLTAWFVLFCNTVTSSHREDLHLLETLAKALMPNVSLSHPITVIKQLCEDFIALSQSHFAILSGETDIEVESSSSRFHSQFSQCNAGSNSGIVPIQTSNDPFPMSNMYETGATNENENPATLDFFFANPLALDFPDDLLDFGTC